MDKSTRTGYLLMFVLFLGFFYFTYQNKEEIEEGEAIEEQQQATQVDTVETNVVLEDTALAEIEDTISLEFEEKEYTLKNAKLALAITNRGGVPSRAEIIPYKRFDSSDLVLFDSGQSSFSYRLRLSSGEISTKDLQFVPTIQNDSVLSLRAKVPGGGSIEQTYKLAKNGYTVDYDVAFNKLNKVLSPSNQYVIIDWSSKIQQQEKVLEDEADKTTVYYKYVVDDDVDNLSEAGIDEESLEAGVHWLSYKQKFFNQTLIHETGFQETGIKIETKPAIDESYVEELVSEIYLPIESEQQVHNMKWFIGPNHYQTLKKQDVKLERLINFGWGILRWVSTGVIIPIFNFLEQYISNYGIIILLLTLFIKMILIFPMFKVYQSSAKMKVLKPELDAIKEKSEGDMSKQQQEQMKLYKQAGVSPLGGCLPQLVQFPILFAMFYFFPTSIELRHEALWWCNDLSNYDSIYTFPNGFRIPGYGDHISLFTLMMTGVTLAYTFMNSQMTGQLQGPMKYIMYIMPVMFLGFFNNYAAALSFYYFLSTSITIVQNWVIRKFFIDEDKLRKKIEKNKKKKVGAKKKTGFQKRLEKMAKERGVDLNNPGKRKTPPKKPNKNRK